MGTVAAAAPTAPAGWGPGGVAGQPPAGQGRGGVAGVKQGRAGAEKKGGGETIHGTLFNSSELVTVSHWMGCYSQ